MPRLLSAVIAGTAVLLLTGSARAGSEEVEGLGFRARAPSGFRATSSENESRTCKRAFERPAPGGGMLVLTFHSHDNVNTQLARTEMALARMVEARPGAPGRPDIEPHVTPGHVSGADDAFELLTRDDERVQRSMKARLDTVVMTMTLESPPAGEHELDEAWLAVTGSMRMEYPGAGLGAVVVWVLVGLVVLAVIVTLMKASRRKPLPPPRPPPAPEHRPAPVPVARDPFVPSPAAPPPPAPEPVEESPISAALDAVLGEGVTSSAPASASTSVPDAPGPRGPGFSRAEDGLPVFTPEQKAAGIPDQPLRRRPDPVRVPAPPKTPPKPVLNRPPVPRPPLPAFKITKF
jgi:hypothetical protein